MLDLLYSLGKAIEEFLFPSPSEEPPKFRLTSKLVKSEVTLHELVSLHLQLCFISYLLLNFLLALLTRDPLPIIMIALPYFLYLRYLFRRYGHFLLDERPYRVFYMAISGITFVAFLAYTLFLRSAWISLPVLVAVLLFRWYFRRTFGRDHTYGIVEELKGDLARVFVHDDMAANVKPGRYWLPAVPGLEPGTVVKVLVEERPLRSARPVRIIEVYQSSQSSTEPKKATE